MTHLEQLELEAELSLVKIEATIVCGLVVLECIEALSPEAYLDIIDNK